MLVFDDFLGSRSPIQSLSATFIPPMACEMASVLSLCWADGRESEPDEDELPFLPGDSRDGRDRNTFDLRERQQRESTTLVGDLTAAHARLTCPLRRRSPWVLPGPSRRPTRWRTCPPAQPGT